MGKHRILVVTSKQQSINDDLRLLAEKGFKVTFSNYTAESSDVFMKFATVNSMQDFNRLRGLEFNEVRYLYPAPDEKFLSFFNSLIR